MKRQTTVWAAFALLMSSSCLVAAPLRPSTIEVPPDAAMRPLMVQDAPDDQGFGAEAPADEEPAPKKKKKQEEVQEEAPAEAAPQAEPEPEAAPKQKAAPEPEAAPAPEPEAAPAPQPEAAPAPETEQPQAEPEPAPKKKKKKPEPEQPAAEQPAAPAEQPSQFEAPKQPDEPAPAEQAAPAEQLPAAEAPAQEEPAKQKPGKKEKAPKAEKKPAADAAPAPETPATDQPQGEQAPAEPPAAAPAPAGEAPADQPDSFGQKAPAGEGLPENAAPVLDSQKPQAPPSQFGGKQKKEPKPAQQAEKPAPAEPAGPPPADDSAAQKDLAPVTVAPVAEEKGKRRDKAPDIRKQERPDDVDVLKEVGDRVIIQLNNQVIVESDDSPRMTRGARDVYYEDLPRGRTRETVTRENGVQVVTIRNRYGDVVRRSRITPDGREYVLSYVDDNDYEERGDWRDPGDDLPPMQLNIPVDEYILDSEDVSDPDRYYEFLDEPPVEQVERLYSVDEVKRSARIRDKTRRVDLDTVTFEFGSASIVESEIPRLEGVAKAMEKLLEKNPAETFLIEGHTDAVGSDVANLALSDRRAEAVADALSNVFAIPPENLTTQGYGEQYLKIKTDKPEQANRRVAIRRITPLVAPVASAN